MSIPVTRAPAPAASSATFPAPHAMSSHRSPGCGASASTSAAWTSPIDSATSSNAPADQATAARCFSSAKSDTGANLLLRVVRVELRERLAGGLLLGGLLRPAFPSPELLPADDRRAGETAVVRRPVDGDLGVRHVTAGAGEQLLQSRLLVAARREPVLDHKAGLQVVRARTGRHVT